MQVHSCVDHFFISIIITFEAWRCSKFNTCALLITISSIQHKNSHLEFGEYVYWDFNEFISKI